MRQRQYACNIRLVAYQVREASGPAIRSAEDIAKTFPDAAAMDREVFYVLTLTQKNEVIDRHMVSIGTLSAALVHPREAFKPAILDGAACVAFLHNHPSGDPTPSREDRELTRRLKEAGELLGITVLDHVIIGRDRLYGFQEEGAL